MKCFFSAFFAVFILVLSMFSTAASANEAGGKVIRVGWVPRLGMSDVNDGVYSGYNYDYLMEIAKYTGWSYEFYVGTAEEVSGMLERGEIDIHGTLLYSDERELIYDYSVLPYGYKYTILFTPQDSTLRENGFESFDGISVGYLNADVKSLERLQNFAETSGITCTTVGFETSEELTSAVENGTVDTGAVDSYITDPRFRVIAKFSPIPYYFATTEGNSEILNELNRALYKINVNRPYIERELYEKYLGIHFNSALTEHETAVVKSTQSNPITVGVIDSSAPVCYRNSADGKYEGIVIELMKLISKKTGLKIEFVPVDMSRREDAKNPNEKSPQIVVGITHSEELPDERGWLLSNELMADSLAVVEKRGANHEAASGEKTVAVMANFVHTYEFAKIYMPDYTIVEYLTLEDCLNAVESGENNTAIYLRSSINYMLQKPRFSQLEVVPTYNLDMDVCIAGFTADSEVYISIVNKGLNMITDDENKSVVLNYTVKNPYQFTIEDTLYEYRIQLILLLTLVLTIAAALTALYIVHRKSTQKIEEALVLAKQASVAKGNFMSHMSHEIRTPLNAIIGYNTIARNELTEARTDAEHRQAEMKVMDCLTKSEIASRNLLSVINDVLDMSAIENSKILISHERFDFKNLINSLTVLFYAQAKQKNVAFEVLFDKPTEEWFVGDQLRLNQILTNLLSNAVKFTSEGKVELVVKQQNNDEKTTSFHFEVTDTGIGMTQEYLDHIWTPFEQADGTISRRFGGTGLGMSITKTLVDLMHGQITVESVYGSGTKFAVDLTLERTEQPVESASYDFKDIHALVIDDDACTCNYIKLLFERCGASCITVNSGEDALALVSSGKDNCIAHNVCLVDWHMPGMDGIETVKRIRELAGANMLIIVVTAYDYTEICESAEEAGVNMFISKPLFQSSLFDLLADICGKGGTAKLEKSVKYDFAGARVLLAEDNKMNMEIAKRIFESAGLTVDSAWNGNEVVDMFKNAPVGTYKAILMDVHMPELDGHEATRIIRALPRMDAAEVPIIAMTADAFAENVSEAYEAGMNDHVSKPIELNTLFGILRKYIKNEIEV